MLYILCVTKFVVIEQRSGDMGEITSNDVSTPYSISAPSQAMNSTTKPSFSWKYSLS